MAPQPYKCLTLHMNIIFSLIWRNRIKNEQSEIHTYSHDSTKARVSTSIQTRAHTDPSIGSARDRGHTHNGVTNRTHMHWDNECVYVCVRAFRNVNNNGALMQRNKQIITISISTFVWAWAPIEYKLPVRWYLVIVIKRLSIFENKSRRWNYMRAGACVHVGEPKLWRAL